MISTSMSIIPARCGPNQFHHSDIKPRKELLGDLKATLARQNITLPGRARLRERLRAGDAAKSAPMRLAFHSIADLASTCACYVDRGRTTSSSRGRNGPGCERAYGLSFRMQTPDCSRTSCMPRWLPAEGPTVIAGYTSDGLIAKIRPGGAGRSPTRDFRLTMRSYCSRRNAQNDQALRAALQPLLGRIDIFRDARSEFARPAGGDGASSPDAVARWLWEKIGKR